MGTDESVWNSAFGNAELEDLAFGLLVLLLDDPAWVNRRVETIELLTHEVVRRSTSLDFTIPEEILEDLSIGHSQFLVPVAFLKKQKLRNFDIQRNGLSLPVINKSDNDLLISATVRLAALLAFQEAAIDVADDHPVWKVLDHIVCEREELAELAKQELIQNAEEGNEIASTLVDDGAVSFLIQMLPANYVLVAYASELAGRSILKYGFDERLDMRGSFGSRIARGARWAEETIGKMPLLLEIEVPAASRASSYHAEIVIPEELRIEHAFALADTPGGDGAEGDPELLDVDDFADRGSLYLADVGSDRAARIVMGIRAQRSGFPAVAAFVAILISCILGFGAWVADLSAPGSNSAITVVLALSAILTAAVIRIDEHPLVRQLLWGPRAILVAIGLLALGAAGSLGFANNPTTVQCVWSTSAGLSIVLSLALVSYATQALPLRIDSEVFENPAYHEIRDEELTESEGDSVQ